jgi:hypothetical protein
MKHGRLLLALVVTTVLLGATAARAADGIGISDDGTSWSDGLDAPLFDPALRWVPGDSRTETFFVRNQGPSGATMTIEARSRDEDELLADDDVDLRARADGGAWVELRNGVASTRLTDGAIGQGGIVRVDVNARFDPTSTNQSQSRQLALRLRVTLADARGDVDHGGGADADADVDADADADTHGPVDAGPGGDEGNLPATGAPALRDWAALGALTLALGGLLARRGREADDHG